MRAIGVALMLAVAVSASIPAPATGEVARLAGVWRGNWGSTTGTYDPTHTLDVSFNAFGLGAMDVQESGDLCFVQCRENDTPHSGAGPVVPANGGVLTCSVTRSGGQKQGFVGVLDAAGQQFSGTYVHFNVPGLLTPMLLTRVPNPPTPPPHPVAKSALACEGTAALLSCADDAPHARIRVTDAFYGRADTATCPSANMRDTACSLSGAARVVQALCDGQRACALDVSNTQFGADPCYLTSKYARVTYTCV